MLDDPQRQELGCWNVRPELDAVTPSVQGEPLYAKGVSVVQGAIICPNANVTSALFQLYTTAWSEQFQDRLEGKQAQMVRGKAMTDPDPAEYGCTLLAPGTPMLLDRNITVVPVVTAKLPNGASIKGVTLSDMYSSQP